MQDRRTRSAMTQEERDILEVEFWLRRIEMRRDAVHSTAREAFERLVKWAEGGYR